MTTNLKSTSLIVLAIGWAINLLAYFSTLEAHTRSIIGWISLTIMAIGGVSYLLASRRVVK